MPDVIAMQVETGCRKILAIRAVMVIAVLCGAVHVSAEEVACHYTYGGEVRRLVAAPVESAYSVGTIEVGSYFRFRVVFQNRPADLAAIKVYAYADTDDGRMLIHQATYPYPPARQPSPYGFTGLHHVYEPVTDGEMQYWCEWISGKPMRGKVQP